MATSTDSEVIERQIGAVRRVILNRPQKHNAITPEMDRALFAALDRAMDDSATRVVVLSGAGPSFCSGADHNAEATSAPTEWSAATDMVLTTRRVDDLLRLWSMPKPLIAQVHGYCLGTANELTSCCDLVVCGASAQIGAPEVSAQVAMVPTLGFWPAVIGLQRTKELMLVGRLVDGEEAVRLGMAISAVPDDELEGYVDALAAKIARIPAPLLAVAKQAANAWWEVSGVGQAARRGADFHPLFHSSLAQEPKRTAAPDAPLDHRG